MEGSNGTVLVVDDSDSMRLLCRVNLELEGYRVLEAATLADAEGHLADEPVHVVLLDVHVGEENGYDLLERLRPLGFTASDPGGLYRALRSLEEEGLVDSAWERSQTGPDRRIYRVTRAGVEHLHQRAKVLAETRGALDVFLSRYEEWVALGRPVAEPAGEPR